MVGPNLKLHQAGLKKVMALELYKPFVMAKLVEYQHASNVKSAKRIIEQERPEVWEVLEEICPEMGPFNQKCIYFDSDRAEGAVLTAVGS